MPPQEPRLPGGRSMRKRRRHLARALTNDQPAYQARARRAEALSSTTRPPLAWTAPRRPLASSLDTGDAQGGAPKRSQRGVGFARAESFVDQHQHLLTDLWHRPRNSALGDISYLPRPPQAPAPVGNCGVSLGSEAGQVRVALPGLPQVERVAHSSHTHRDVCLVQSLRGLGVPVPVTRSGPFWALRDGTAMLEPFSMALAPIPLKCAQEDGKYVAHIENHFTAYLKHQHIVVCLSNDGPRLLDAHAFARYVKRAGWLAFRLRKASASVFFGRRGCDPPWATAVDAHGGMDVPKRRKLTRKTSVAYTQDEAIAPGAPRGSVPARRRVPSPCTGGGVAASNAQCVHSPPIGALQGDPRLEADAAVDSSNGECDKAIDRMLKECVEASSMHVAQSQLDFCADPEYMLVKTEHMWTAVRQGIAGVMDNTILHLAVGALALYKLRLVDRTHIAHVVLLHMIE